MKLRQTRKKRTEALGKFIRALRIEKRITTREFSALLGIGANYLHEIEFGKKSLVDPILFHKLAEIFKIPVEEFLIKSGYLNKKIDNDEEIKEKFDKIKNNYFFSRRFNERLNEDIMNIVIQMHTMLRNRDIIIKESI